METKPLFEVFVRENLQRKRILAIAIALDCPGKQISLCLKFTFKENLSKEFWQLQLHYIAGETNEPLCLFAAWNFPFHQMKNANISFCIVFEMLILAFILLLKC